MYSKIQICPPLQWEITRKNERFKKTNKKNVKANLIDLLVWHSLRTCWTVSVILNSIYFVSGRFPWSQTVATLERL